MTSRCFSAALILTFSLQNFLHADNSNEYIPLYAGTMLAFYSQNIDPGRLAVQGYLFKTRLPGIYDKDWSFQRAKTINELSLLVLLETGITRYLDVTLLLNTSYNVVHHQHSFLFEDTRAFLGFQISRDEKGAWVPDFRILLGENFPTGKYQHLDPKKILSDSSGSGSYATSFIVVTSKTFYVFPMHPFNLNLNLLYTFSSNVNVEGFNIYGGVANTRGEVKPGDIFLANLAIEYSLTRNWVLGLDTRYLHQNRSVFSGKKGKLKKSKASFGLPSSEQFSLAPCLEYNYNEVFGILAGTWFTVTGRNSENFLSGIVSIYYEF